MQRHRNCPKENAALQNMPHRYYTHLSVIATSSDVLPIGTVCEAVHVVEVTLLLENVGLTLPFPDQELPHPRAGQGDPITRRVEGHRRDTLLGNTANIAQCRKYWVKTKMIRDYFIFSSDFLMCVLVVYSKSIIA